MNKEEKKEFAFDAFELKSILTYHLTGNEYRLFDFISYKCRVNDNWWEYTNEEWENLTGMSHRTFLTAKKSLEEKKIIINLNKGKRNKNADGTICNRRNRLSVNVDFILSLKKEKEQKSEYKFENNFKKELGADVAPKSEQTKGAKIALMVKETETKGAKDCITKGAKIALDNNKTKEKEYNTRSNSSCTRNDLEENERRIEDLEEDRSYLTEEDNRIFQKRQEFKHINEEEETWVDRYFKTLESVEGELLTTNMRVILSEQFNRLYDDRPNDNFNVDFKIFQDRIKCPHFNQMQTAISQAERNNAL